MNARTEGRYLSGWLRRLLHAVCVCPALAALACSLEGAVPGRDPLQTLPEIVRSGVSLPGDAAVLACPEGTDLSGPLALSRAVDVALCNNPQIRVAWAGIKVQAGVLGEARAAYFPAVSATVNAMHSSTAYSHQSATVTDGLTAYGTVGWRLSDFGGREANRQAAADLLQAAVASHDAVLQKTLAGVIQADFDAQTSQAVWEAKRKDAEVALSTLDAARRREVKGVGAVGDTLQATAAHARAVLGMNRARGDYEKAVSVLAYMMGISAQSPITPADDAYDATGPDHNDLQAWLDHAQAKHPAILAARAQLDAAKAKITVSRSAALPTVDFSANYYRNGYPGQSLSPTQLNSYTAGISVTIPLFDGFAGIYKIRGAEALAEQRQSELQDAERGIVLEVVKAYAEASASFRNLEYSETLVQAARAALASAQRRFDKGAADILEILSAQMVMADAAQERVRCLADWRSARLRLMANAGLLGRSSMAGPE